MSKCDAGNNTWFSFIMPFFVSSETEMSSVLSVENMARYDTVPWLAMMTLASRATRICCWAVNFSGEMQLTEGRGCSLRAANLTAPQRSSTAGQPAKPIFLDPTRMVCDV